MSAPSPTLDVAARIAGSPLMLDDPLEAYHEASRLAPSTVAARMAGSVRLQADPLLQVAATRATRRHPHRPAVELAPPRLPRMRLRDALLRRSSRPSFGAAPNEHHLSALLAAAYAVRPREGRARRPVPSAGALYPLELYPLVADAGEVAAGVYHYDPFRHRLELLQLGDPAERLAAAVVDGALARDAAVTVAVSAMLPRSRFKYGQRAYRFALLEAGHVAQNLLLAATALGIAATPYGGFYDRRLDELVGADGIDEVSVYLLFLGRRS